jgi:hypothetical protein
MTMRGEDLKVALHTVQDQGMEAIKVVSEEWYLKEGRRVL